VDNPKVVSAAASEEALMSYLFGKQDVSIITTAAK
jgi:hypothetical protein